MLSYNELSQLATKLNTACSCMVGFSIYGRMIYGLEDVRLARSMFVRGRVLSTLTRVVYFVGRYLVVAYLLVTVLYSNETQTRHCRKVSRFIVASFFVIHLSNHWLFASRLIAIWHTHEKRAYIYAFTLLGLSGLLVLSILNLDQVKMYDNYPSVGCMVILDDKTMPPARFTLAMCIYGLLFHTTNLLLAISRLSTFREDGASADLTPTWTKFYASFRSLFQHRRESRFTLAQDLIDQGFHYWAVRTVMVTALVCIPNLAISKDPAVIMSCFAGFATVDTELSGAIYRATINAATKMCTNMKEDVHFSHPNPLTDSPFDMGTAYSASPVGLVAMPGRQAAAIPLDSPSTSGPTSAPYPPQAV